MTIRSPIARRSRRGSLIVVGTGIKGVVQATLETVACMKEAGKLFYVVTDRTTEYWIRQLNPTATSLTDLYEAGKPRRQTYEDMAARLVEAVRAGHQVCAAFYGHPGVLVNAAHWAIRQVRLEGYSARMLPGISADACLFADLGVNPGDCGVQSFEATDFLESRRRFDPTSQLLLWQVGVIGESRTRIGVVCRPERLKVLTDTLLRHYPPRHRVILYQAASFAAHDHVARRIALERLPRTRVGQLALLYVPALPQRSPDRRIARWYDEA